MRKALGGAFLKLTGWTARGTKPDEARYVVIAAPHTSNWDFPYLIAFAWFFELDVSWMGKHSLFRPPMGWLMRALGGLPVVRHRSEDVVSQMVSAFERSSSMVLAIAPEGTRGYVPAWKSGFYRIAVQAEVPIAMAYLDYSRKEGGFGPVFRPTGDMNRDMDVIRGFYADKAGKRPALAGTVRLKDEG